MQKTIDYWLSEQYRCNDCKKLLNFEELKGHTQGTGHGFFGVELVVREKTLEAMKNELAKKNDNE
jgi:hypothetical protein